MKRLRNIGIGLMNAEELMMNNFTTWINSHPAAGLLSETDIKNMKVAWDMVVDEAVKVVKNEHTPNCDHAADQIKELKE